MRKIRAYYREGNCNAKFGFILQLLLIRSHDCPTFPCDHAVQPLTVRASYPNLFACFPDIIQNLGHILLGRHLNLRTVRVMPVEDQAAIGTRQSEESECIFEFLKETPHLRLLPAPSLSKSIQGQGTSVFPILDRGSQKRKRIAVISVGGMTPQIQPCVCFLKFSITNKSLRNISGDAEKPISLCGVYGTVLTLRPGTLHNPILDLVYEMLGFLVKSVSDITQLLQLLHDTQSLCPLFDPKNALQPNHTSGPHSWCHRVRMAAVDSIPLAECCTGGKLGPIAH